VFSTYLHKEYLECLTIFMLVFILDLMELNDVNRLDGT